MLDELIDRIVGIPAVWHVVQNILGYPEDKIRMYRSAVMNRGRLLDFGCASGHLGEAFAAVDYVGIDCDRRAILGARRRWAARANMQWVCEDIFTRPFKKGEFDQVLLGCTFHHLRDSIAIGILKELAYCLRPAGILHVFDPVYQDTDGFATRMLRRLDRGKYTRTLDQIAAAITASGEFDLEHAEILAAPRSFWRDCDTGYLRAVRTIRA